jgi:Protein of unknown function (DUF1631)
VKTSATTLNLDGDKEAATGTPATTLVDPRKRKRSRSSGIERGQWVMLIDDNGKVQRCKVSWVSPMKETFVLKNYDTKEAIKLESSEWRTLKAEGRLKRIEESSLTERSLEGAIRGVLEKGAPAATTA